jgi:hypothetical protein
LAQERHYDSTTWGAMSDTLRAPVPGTRITLHAAFIVPGSVVVRVNGEVLGPDRYQVNLHLGTIRFIGDLPKNAVVVVSYQRKPLLMSPVYSLRPAEVSKPDSSGVSPERVVTPRAPEPEATPGTDLRRHQIGFVLHRHQPRLDPRSIARSHRGRTAHPHAQGARHSLRQQSALCSRKETPRSCNTSTAYSSRWRDPTDAPPSATSPSTIMSRPSHR